MKTKERLPIGTRIYGDLLNSKCVIENNTFISPYIKFNEYNKLGAIALCGLFYDICREKYKLPIKNKKFYEDRWEEIFNLFTKAKKTTFNKSQEEILNLMFSKITYNLPFSVKTTNLF